MRQTAQPAPKISFWLIEKTSSRHQPDTSLDLLLSCTLPTTGDALCRQVCLLPSRCCCYCTLVTLAHLFSIRRVTQPNTVQGVGWGDNNRDGCAVQRWEVAAHQ